MHTIEGIPEVKNNKFELEHKREQTFVAFMLSKIIEEFEEDLEDVFENESMTMEVVNEINSFSSEEQRMIMSIPKSIRQQRFRALFNKYNQKGRFDAKSFVSDLFEDAKNNGYTIGYHASLAKISENESDWTVNPTGMDDRDDRPMAYYSLDYKNIFRKNRGRFIYAIRAETGHDSTHKRDTSNNWGRANKLSVITSVDLEEIDKRISEMENQEIKEAA